MTRTQQDMSTFIREEVEEALKGVRKVMSSRGRRKKLREREREGGLDGKTKEKINQKFSGTLEKS